jgi:hypothetical protein
MNRWALLISARTLYANHNIYQDTSRPDAITVSAEAVPASVWINPFVSKVCPTNSGQVYVSFGATDLVFTIKFALDADPPDAIRFALKTALAALVFVTVNLSMIALQFVAVYCVVCAASICFAGIRFLIVTVMLFS